MAGERTRGGLDLHLDLAFDLTGGAAGVGRALERELREAVRSGRLAAGVRLPGSRGLAADLGLSRGTVVQVYTQLIAEGWLIGTPGSGTRVAGVPPGPGPAEPPAGRRPGPRARLGSGDTRGREAPDQRAGPRAGTPARPGRALDGHEPVPHRGWADLRPGRPDLSSFPRGLWAASVRRAAAAADPDLFDYGELAGVPALRAAVADYVSRTRGVRATARTVVVTAGFSHGLALLARTFERLGVRRAGVEDPCLGRHRGLLGAAGLETVPLAVDADGADPAALDDGVGAVLLTPAHQHPWGAVLAPGRRTAFVDWARRNDAYLIEDDYDGEFRYDQRPVGALQALAPDRVVYGGTASKALAPGARIGWLVVPEELHDPLLDTIEDTAAMVPVLDQLALADLLGRGDYDRHVRRLRLTYRRRRTELAERLAAVTPTPLEGVSAGLHALLPVASVERERALIAAGVRAGVLTQGLHSSGYWHTAEGRPAALVLGYATPPPHAWRRSLDLLTELIATDEPGPAHGVSAAKPSRQEG
ncbi:PLP-dependent aminotransferase family protein [Actinoallomurus iriomotensis]|uniref:GntR family transcriptional regulator n=1 Tax=Actinoallomurus iriomotensis TaxID=478107 RepID=A0A9W6SGS1_9ACTN|nr:PLP-dependent aminotransferase family protein [Actinoallomurus iriomotensis]GLY91932.1 GntR family transcriptional regulator [Actinoallomurus iriomotensis]